MADAAQNAGVEATAERRYLTFRVDQRLYALPADEIAEVIPIPAIARLPHSPMGLLGVANVRGSVLPVASLRGLLGREPKPADPGARAIVLDGLDAVAVAVDAVEMLVSLRSETIEVRQAELAIEPGEILRGAFRTQTLRDVAKILDVQRLLASVFSQRSRPRRHKRTGPGAGAVVEPLDGGASLDQMLITFEVAGREYALSADHVREIVPWPDTTAFVPRSEALVLGVASYRDALLPLLSLRALLGFERAAETDGREKIIVTSVAGFAVGLVADRMRAIVRADASLVDPTPPILAARAGGETAIKSIYRGDGGRRMISILAADQLFREDVMRRLGDSVEPAPAPGAIGGNGAHQLQFVVFRLGDEEFALPIGSVDEVVRVPDQIARIPKTPKFLEGVINLRGEVVPVVDQRRRFELPKFTGARERRRMIVVHTERHRAALIVDSVSEVLRVTGDAVEAAPDLAKESTPLVHGVINLGASGRMVLLLDPAELLSRSERGLLDAFSAATASASS